MKSKLMAAVLMMMSFGAVAPAAVVAVAPVARPYVTVRVAPVVVYAGPRYYYAAPVYPVYGVRVYGGYRYGYGYGPRYYSRGGYYRGYRR
jgi:hypothetical protein